MGKRDASIKFSISSSPSQLIVRNIKKVIHTVSCKILRVHRRDRNSKDKDTDHISVLRDSYNINFSCNLEIKVNPALQINRVF